MEEVATAANYEHIRNQDISAEREQALGTYLYLCVIVLIGITYGVAIAFRYVSPWSEGDTSFFARVIASLLDSGTLLGSANREIYPQGFVYQTWAVALTSITGVSVPIYIQQVSPILGCAFLGLFGFAIFRKILNSDAAGFFAALLLFIVPELVFVVARGNHEKLTIAYTLLAVLALFSSFDELIKFGRHRLFATWTVCYYLFVASAASTNAYFGSTVVCGITIMWIALSLLAKLFPHMDPLVAFVAQRLRFTVLGSWLIVMLVLFYGYPPASNFLVVLETTAERLAALLLSFAPESNPYVAVAQTWVSQEAYLAISLFRWVLFTCSFLTWVVLSIKVWRHREKISLHTLFLLAFYGSFGFLLGLALPVDLVGLDVGTNLQVRLYIYFALFSAPVFAYGVYKLLQRNRQKPWLYRTVVGTAGIAVALFSVTGFLKVTHDPSVSKVWRFYEPEEASAVLFFVNHQPNRTRHLWIGPDQRLRHAYYTSYPDVAVDLLFNPATGLANAAALNLSDAEVTPSTDYALDSEVVRTNTVIWEQPLPTILLRDQIYDNGKVGIVYKGRETPFVP